MSQFKGWLWVDFKVKYVWVVVDGGIFKSNAINPSDIVKIDKLWWVERKFEDTPMVEKVFLYHFNFLIPFNRRRFNSQSTFNSSYTCWLLKLTDSILFAFICNKVKLPAYKIFFIPGGTLLKNLVKSLIFKIYLKFQQSTSYF